MPARVADLRSDTVTQPSAGMRAAIAAAEVGDDVYGEDPTTNALEARVAELFGHEAALFVPSGTMGNQVAVQVLAKPRQEVICDAEAHLVLYESGGLAVTGGVSTRTFGSRSGLVDVDVVAGMLGRFPYATPVAAVSVENTHMRSGGTIQPIERLRELRSVTAAAGVALHCDGARIWHAHVADREPLAAFGTLFDSMSVCLSKGLGAPVGSLVLATRERIAEARRLRMALGGQMRQVGVLAAAGLYALEHHVARLVEDHARARRLAEELAPFGVVDPAAVRTNIVNLDLSDFEGGARDLVARAAGEGVLAVDVAPFTVRLVTHMDLDDDDLDHAVRVLAKLLDG